MKYILKKVDVQRDLMCKLFHKFELKDFSGWKTVSKSKFTEGGGHSLLYYHYSNDINKLFLTIFPNYPWETNNTQKDEQTKFDDNEAATNRDVNNKKITNDQTFKIIKLRSNESILKTSRNFQKFKIKEQSEQRRFLEFIFKTLQLTTLSELSFISKYKIQHYGSGKRLLKLYSGNYNHLLRTVFPNYPWEMSITQLSASKLNSAYFKEWKNQRSFMNDIFQKLRYDSLADMKLNLTPYQLKKFRGFSLLSMYESNLQLLLQSVYPNYPWEWNDDDNNNNVTYSSMEKQTYLLKHENQRSFMNQLSQNLNLSLLSDWYEIPIYKIVKHGGNRILNIHSFDLKKLLTTIYPNYPWCFKEYGSAKQRLQTTEKRRDFLEKLFMEYRLKSLHEWMFIPKRKLIKDGGKYLLYNYYHNDMKLLLTSLYPNYPWDFSQLKQNSNSYFKSQINQRKFMDSLYNKLNLRSLNDWVGVSKYKLIENGGQSLILHYYNGNMKKLLRTIYPNHDWNFDQLRYYSNDYKSLKYQRSFMEKLFHQFQFTSLDEWYKISKQKFIDNGGKTLLSYYSNNLKSMLHTIYPNYPFMHTRKHSNYTKLLKFIDKYDIREKKDWYRLPNVEVDVVQLLKTNYPSETWNTKLLHHRNKKTHQRLLFILLKKLYPSLLVIENYKHPHLISPSSHPLEFDIFIPSFNLAIEYQGQQHFDDIPSYFNYIQSYQFGDQTKLELANLLNIKLVHIPYWWDGSPQSLLSAISPSFKE